MGTVTRRRFLTASGVVAAGALAAGGTAQAADPARILDGRTGRLEHVLT